MNRNQFYAFLILSFFVAAGVLNSGGLQIASKEGVVFADIKNLKPKLDVPYVPSKEEVVEEMLKLARISAGDVVYDLGCGDGRIVIAAAEKKGATCVGVDIDPERIKECRLNAEKARVADKVKFYEKDLFETDIRSASVVTLYLLPDINMKLRPKLLRDLKPGSRVVSHNYDMQDWRPDDFKKIGVHTVYYWIVPANVTGKWNWTIRKGTARRSYSMRMEQQFQNAKGWVTNGAVKMQMKDVRLTGDRLFFNITQKNGGEQVPMRFEGQVQGDVISGIVYSEPRGRGKQPEKVKWTAEREGSTGEPLDGSQLVLESFPLFLTDSCLKSS